MKLTRRSFVKRAGALAAGAALAPALPLPTHARPPIVHDGIYTLPGHITCSTSSLGRVDWRPTYIELSDGIPSQRLQRRQRAAERTASRGCWADLEDAVRQHRKT
jgi:hypothetical protein